MSKQFTNPFSLTKVKLASYGMSHYGRTVIATLIDSDRNFVIEAEYNELLKKAENNGWRIENLSASDLVYNNLNNR